MLFLGWMGEGGAFYTQKLAHEVQTLILKISPTYLPPSLVFQLEHGVIPLSKGCYPNPVWICLLHTGEPYPVFHSPWLLPTLPLLNHVLPVPSGADVSLNILRYYLELAMLYSWKTEDLTLFCLNLLNASNSQCWVKQKAGAIFPICVSHKGGRDPSPCTITCCLTGCTLAGSWNRKQTQDSNPGTLIKACIPNNILTVMPNTLNWVCFT